MESGYIRLVEREELGCPLTNSWGAGRGSTDFLSLLPCACWNLPGRLAQLDPQCGGLYVGGSKGSLRTDGVLVEVDLEPFFSAVQNNLKNILLGDRATFVSNFLYYLVPTSLLEAMKVCIKQSLN